ncbi:hypothetical protein RZE82_05605 [Mollicutes bacterium LVI A0039]|nr:hypothetical protein RZE82_05605 [Mollicutes bacterium LVI A0039]
MKKLYLLWPIVLFIVIIGVALGTLFSNKNDFCGEEQFQRSTRIVTMDSNPVCTDNRLEINNLGNEMITFKITEIKPIDSGYEEFEVIEETNIEPNGSVNYNLDGLDQSYQYEFRTLDNTDVYEYTYQFY